MSQVDSFDMPAAEQQWRQPRMLGMVSTACADDAMVCLVEGLCLDTHGLSWADGETGRERG
jgi:hypothetical protein